MNFYVDIQHACTDKIPVTDAQLSDWAMKALRAYRECGELTLRLVDQDEIRLLNSQYRKKNSPTNVLAFPTNYPSEIALEFPVLGDIIVCPAVLAEESIGLAKPLDAHWAHIVIHGVLHLLGYDHIADEEAQVMQAIEVTLLQQLGFANPYDETEEDDKIA